MLWVVLNGYDNNKLLKEKTMKKVTFKFSNQTYSSRY